MGHKRPKVDLQRDLPPPPAPGDNERWAAEWLHGDWSARDTLIVRNQKLAHSIVLDTMREQADGLAGYGDGYDLHSVALLSLVRAVDALRDNRNVAGYLAKSIRGALRDFLAAERAVALPPLSSIANPKRKWEFSDETDDCLEDHLPAHPPISGELREGGDEEGKVLDLIAETPADRQAMELRLRGVEITRVAELVGMGRTTCWKRLQYLAEKGRKLFGNAERISEF